MTAVDRSDTLHYRPNRRALIAWAALGAGAAALTACAPPAASPTAAPAKPSDAAAPKPDAKPAAGMTQPPAKASGPVKIGLNVSITGPLALIGIQARNGAAMAIEEINAKSGVKFDVVQEDAGSDNTTATNSFLRVVSQQPVAILGPTVSTMMFAISPHIKESKIPTFFGSSNASLTRQGIPYLFRLILDDDRAGTIRAQYAVQTMKKTRIAHLFVNDEYGTGAYKWAQKILKEKYSVDMVAGEQFAGADKDFTAQLLNIKNKNADVMFQDGYPANLALVWKQMKQLAIGIAQFGAQPPVMPSTLDLVNDDEADAIYSVNAGFPAISTDPKVPEWVNTYKAKSKNLEPDTYATNYYDAAYMLSRVIEEVGPDREKIRDGLLKLKNFKGIGMLPYTADQTGDLLHSGVLTQNIRKKQKLLAVVDLPD